MDAGNPRGKGRNATLLLWGVHQKGVNSGGSLAFFPPPQIWTDCPPFPGDKSVVLAPLLDGPYVLVARG